MGGDRLTNSSDHGTMRLPNDYDEYDDDCRVTNEYIREQYLRVCRDDECGHQVLLSSVS